MEKFKVSFTADNQQLKAIGTKHASDTYADIEAEFVLGNRWTDMDSVSAVWWNDFTRIATVLDPQGKCIVPHEVLTRKGCVRVNLVGSVTEGDELVTRLTSYSAEAVQVNEKIKLTGSETSEITPSQFEQFVAVVIAEVEKVTGMTATAETLPAGSDATARYENGVLHLGIPQGIQGETGNGIESVVFDNYALRFTFTDGTVFTTPSIRGADGNGIRSIAKTGTSGLVDTYTITFDDGSTTTYTVTNGAKGEKGETGATPSFSIGTVETLEPTEDATATITGTAENPVLNLGIPQGKTGEVTYEDLESILPRDTASGQIASFPDGQSVIPMHSLKVSLEPIQDLHGYDKPWAGGAGKNLAPNKSPNVPVSYAGVTMTIDGNDFVFKGTSTGTGGRLVFMTESFPLKSGTYFLSVSLSGSGDVYPVLHNASGNVVVKQGAGAVTIAEDINAFIGFNVSGTIGNTFDLKVKCQLESGSTASVWTPYSNLCPISGHTECVTSVSGVNVWDEEWEEGTINTNGDNSSSTTRWRTKNYISIKPNAQYYFKGTKTGSGTASIRPRFYDINKVYIGNTSQSGTDIVANTVFTTPTNAYYMRFTPDKSGTYGILTDEVSINYPSTDHDYHAYNGTSYTTTLGRTVYGGTLDVVSGELVVDRAMVDLGTLNWSQYTADSTSHSFVVSVKTDAKESTESLVPSILCSQYSPTAFMSVASWTSKNSVITQVSAPQRWIVRDENYTDATAFKTAMNGVQLVYELATPQTIQLTPQEVRTLLGTNNVWSDGDVVVVYSADTALWIEKKLNA